MQCSNLIPASSCRRSQASEQQQQQQRRAGAADRLQWQCSGGVASGPTTPRARRAARQALERMWGGRAFLTASPSRRARNSFPWRKQLGAGARLDFCTRSNFTLSFDDELATREIRPIRPQDVRPTKFECAPKWLASSRSGSITSIPSWSNVKQHPPVAQLPRASGEKFSILAFECCLARARLRCAPVALLSPALNNETGCSLPRLDNTNHYASKLHYQEAETQDAGGWSARKLVVVLPCCSLPTFVVICNFIWLVRCVFVHLQCAA